MLLIIRELIRRRGGDLPLFQEAYTWRFNKIVDVWGDVLAYRVQGVIPSYLRDYVKYVESQKDI